MIDQVVFDWRQTKEGLVRITYLGRVVTTLKGQAATRLLARVQNATVAEVQLALAKATGNFKRGNEHTARASLDQSK